MRIKYRIRKTLIAGFVALMFLVGCTFAWERGKQDLIDSPIPIGTLPTSTESGGPGTGHAEMND